MPALKRFEPEIRGHPVKDDDALARAITSLDSIHQANALVSDHAA